MGIIKSNDKIGNININTYGRFNVKEKIYRFCMKCGERLMEGSTSPFCENGGWCQSEYYKELAADMDDIVGRN